MCLWRLAVEPAKVTAGAILFIRPVLFLKETLNASLIEQYDK